MDLHEAQQRLIVALDVSTRDEALGLVDRLADRVGFFKIGLQLFTAHGPDLVREVRAGGAGVFLDLKLHDIPNTVAGAVREACLLDVQLLTLHTLGGPVMLRKAREVVDQHRQSTGKPGPRLLGVTVLTSHTQAEIEGLGFSSSIEDLVLRLAGMAHENGVDGIVCSPHELRRLRKDGPGGLFFVTPGVRPAGASTDDQARIMTAGEAIGLGAGCLVVGRPILRAKDPRQAATALLEEIQSAILEA